MGKLLLGVNLLALITLASGQRGLAAGAEVNTKAVELSPLGPAIELIAQSDLVQITNVRLVETETSLQVILETTGGALATPTTTVSGDALIAEITNAVLSEEFLQFEPTEEVAVVQVSALPENRVQVVITGADAPPIAEISSATTGLTLSVVPGTAQAGSTDEILRLTVTGEQAGYVVPNASTATLTDTPLRDIPQSIQVIPEEILDDQQVLRLNDALRNVSGALLIESNADQRFLLRGFSDPSVLRDGFKLSFGASGNPGIQELNNLEAIEVLKGPASILFGSIEPGGVINLVTKKPLSEPLYELGLRAGSRELFEPSVDLSGPLTEDGRLRYRLNALYRTEDGIQDYNTDRERFFIAPVLSWAISDRTDLSINFEYLDEEAPIEAGLVAIGDEIADIPFSRPLGELDDTFESEIVRAGYNFEHRFSDSWKIRNGFTFNRRERDFLPFFFPQFLDDATGTLGRVPFSSEQSQTVLEVQTNVVGEFNTGSIGHTLLAGFDVSSYDNPGSTRADLFGTPAFLNIFDPVYGLVSSPDPETLPVLLDSETNVDSFGLYIQNQIELSDQFKVLLGGRYDNVNQKVTNNPSLFTPVASETTQSDEAFSPRIGLVYQPIEQLSLYSSYSRSFFPNSGTTAEGALLEPEEGEQFEVGARTELLDGRLTANLALFELTKKNIATPDPNFPTGSGFSIARGEQRSRGVELDVIGEILPGWNVVANYAYTDAEITEDNSGLEGNRPFGVPENNVNLWTTYEIQSGSLEGLSFGLGFNYVSERFGNDINDFEVDDYFLTNAALSYRKDSWRAGLNVRNLFDIDYVEGVRNSRLFSISPGEGLTLVGSFSIEF